MANEVEVVVSAKDHTSSAFNSANKAGRDYGKGLENVGERADKSEQKVLGMKDTVDGVATIMQGPGKQGIAAYLQGWADLASGVANFIVPAVQATVAIARQGLATVISTAAQKTAAAASKAWAAAQWLLNAALSANPIGLVVIALVALVAALVIAWKRSETFRNIVKAALKAVGDAAKWLWEKAIKPAFEAIKGLIDKVLKWFKDLPGNILAAYRNAKEWLLQKGKDILNGLWNGLKEIWNKVKEWGGRIIRAYLDAYRNAGRWLFNKGRDILNGLWNGLKEIWNKLKDWGGRIIRAYIDAYKNAGKWLFQKGKDILNGLWNGLKEVWNKVKSWFSGVPKAIMKALGIASPPKWAIESGQHIMNGLLKGMGLNKQRVVDFAQSFAVSMGPGLAGKGLPGYTGKGPPITAGLSSVQQMVKSMAAQLYGWTGGEWNALYNLIMGESGFDYNAQNPTSTAYGIFQFLNSTWASVGARKSALPYDQTVAGLKYIAQRYFTPSRAYGAWLSRNPHWYHSGGLLTEDIMGIGPSGQIYGLQSGERVVPRNGNYAGGGRVVVEINLSGGDRNLLEWLRNQIRVKGGNVQVVLGR